MSVIHMLLRWCCATATVCFLVMGLVTPITATTGPFPRYQIIRDNVSFWEKIYIKYSINEAVIHDSQDLSKIYEVLPLLDDSLPASQRINANARKAAIAKYEKLLIKLARHSPSTSEEKRIAALFDAKNRSAQMRKAARQVRIQTGLKERFIEGVERSAQYLPEMKKIFRSYQLPEELAYLPHVESSFNTKAYSKFGAAGIWQFTRETGKQYLTIDYTLDERLDPLAATHAAARYLQKSYKHLNSWPLALTSYNYGLAGMLRAVEEKTSYEKIFSGYDKGYFKFASRNFYSEFIAALDAARMLEKQLAGSLQHRQQISHRLPGFIASDQLCSHLGISQNELRGFNPALRDSVFTGEKLIPKGYLLRLPKSSQISTRLASIPSRYFSGQQKASLFHLVRIGDTASSIAKLHGVSLKALMQANNLDKFATIYLKQKLRIPRSARSGVAPSAPVLLIKADEEKILTKVQPKPSQVGVPVLNEENKRAVTTPAEENLPVKDPTIYSVYSVHEKNNKQYGYVTVQPEETLAMLASWLEIPVDDLIRLNRWRADKNIHPGEQLLVAFHKVKPSRLEERRLDFLRETEEDFFSAYTINGRQNYTVVAGDTFWNLCHVKFDIPLWLLERYNSAINLSRLAIGQSLIIPIVQAR